MEDSTSKRNWQAALAAVLVGAAVALSFAAARNDRLPGDLWLGERLQELPGGFETPAEVTRALTTTWVTVVIGTFVVTAFDFTARRRAWLVFSLMLLVLPFLQAAIKNIVDRPRPDPALIQHRAGFTSESFPSGHAMSGTALFLLIAWLVAGRLSRRGKVVTWALCAFGCLLNGVANVYEGVHWPSDVVGGYLWAAVLMLAAILIAERHAVSSPSPAASGDGPEA